MIILQISPEFSPGTGVGGVAHALEQHWLALGHDVRRFGLRQAGCEFLSKPVPGIPGRLLHAARVVWFSTIGTVRARRAVRQLPAGAVTICHNDALAGDVYVNHGVLMSSMRARGQFTLRMVRNPLHIFTAIRDQYRYRSNTHSAIVSLSEVDRTTLVERYGLPTKRAFVIPNGVELDRFAPADENQRHHARDALGIPAEARVAVFVGHEFERKGLPLLLQATSELVDHHVIVVGGTPAEIETSRRGLSGDAAERVHWLGRLPDPRPALAAADVLVLPSAYEANPLVILEALASGLQVVATPVGSVPEVLKDDEVSRVVGRTTAQVREGLVALARLDIDAAVVRRAARACATAQSWSVVACAYIDLFERLRQEALQEE